jgi:ABC-type sugar transport system ATPase subunit
MNLLDGSSWRPATPSSRRACSNCLFDMRPAEWATTGALHLRHPPRGRQRRIGAPVEAKVHDIENHGIEKIVTLRVGDKLVRAAVPAKVSIAVEDAVRFGWNADKVMLFDPRTGIEPSG